MWQLHFTEQARQDGKRLAAAGLQHAAQKLLAVLQEDPYRSQPPYEKLVGDLEGSFSRRINIQQRLVYQVLDEARAVKILRLGHLSKSR